MTHTSPGTGAQSTIRRLGKNSTCFGNAAGTADDVTKGMKLIIDDGTGKVVPTTGTPESEPFVAREAITDPTADQLLWCSYSGV